MRNSWTSSGTGDTPDMKHYSGIDYDHFLDNVRDMYPFSILEAILTELIANALDAKTSLLDIRVDAENRLLEIVDNQGGKDIWGKKPVDRTLRITKFLQQEFSLGSNGLPIKQRKKKHTASK